METFLLVFNFCATLVFTGPKLHQWRFSDFKIMLPFLYVHAVYRQDTILWRGTKNVSQTVS